MIRKPITRNAAAQLALALLGPMAIVFGAIALGTALSGGNARQVLAQDKPAAEREGGGQTAEPGAMEGEAAMPDMPKPVPLEPVNDEEAAAAPEAPITSAEGAAKEKPPAEGKALEKAAAEEAMAPEQGAAKEQAPAEGKAPEKPAAEGNAMEKAPAKGEAKEMAPAKPAEEAMAPGQPEAMEMELSAPEEELAAPVTPALPTEAQPRPEPAPRPPEPEGGRHARLEFGTDYQSGSFRRTTGFISSPAHGNRLVMTHVSPAESAKIYRRNAAKVRKEETSGLESFPEGTVIVMESFAKTRTGGPGAKGPIFVMKKEGPGYDPSGNDWRYGFAQPDWQLIGEGNTGSVAFCKACHATVRDRDWVYAVDR